VIKQRPSTFPPPAKTPQISDDKLKRPFQATPKPKRNMGSSPNVHAKLSSILKAFAMPCIINHISEQCVRANRKEAKNRRLCCIYQIQAYTSTCFLRVSVLPTLLGKLGREPEVDGSAKPLRMMDSTKVDARRKRLSAYLSKIAEW